MEVAFSLVRESKLVWRLCSATSWGLWISLALLLPCPRRMMPSLCSHIVHSQFSTPGNRKRETGWGVVCISEFVHTALVHFPLVVWLCSVARKTMKGTLYSGWPCIQMKTRVFYHKQKGREWCSAGVPNFWDLMPADLKWRANVIIIEIKYTINAIRLNHPKPSSHSWSKEKFSSTKLALVPKSLGTTDVWDN